MAAPSSANEHKVCGRQHRTRLTLFALCSLLAPGAAAQPNGARHGPVFSAELHTSWLAWTEDFDTTLASDNHSARLHFRESVGTRAVGAGLGFGYSVVLHEVVALMPKLALHYAQGQSQDVIYNTASSSYQLNAQARWFSAVLGPEVQLAKWFAVELGYGYGLVHSVQHESSLGAAPAVEHTRSHYIVAIGARLRVPPATGLGGYLGFGHQTLGFSPIRAIWEGNWALANYSYLRLGIDFDTARGEAP